MKSTILTKCSPVNLRNFAHYVEITMSNPAKKTDFLLSFIKGMYSDKAEVIEGSNGYIVYPTNGKKYHFHQLGERYVSRVGEGGDKKIWSIN